MTLKKIAINTLGVILTPILLVIFMTDRMFLACFPWLKIDIVQDWATDHNKIAYSVIRVFFVLLILAVIWLIRIMF